MPLTTVSANDSAILVLPDPEVASIMSGEALGLPHAPPKKIRLSDLFVPSDGLMRRYPPSSLKPAEIMGPQSVIFSWETKKTDGAAADGRTTGDNRAAIFGRGLAKGNTREGGGAQSKGKGKTQQVDEEPGDRRALGRGSCNQHCCCRISEPTRLRKGVYYIWPESSGERRVRRAPAVGNLASRIRAVI